METTAKRLPHRLRTHDDMEKDLAALREAKRQLEEDLAAARQAKRLAAAAAADAVHPAKSYAAVAANAEIEDLRATKVDLEEQLASAAAEAHRLEGLFSQARDDVAIAEHAAATTEAEVASLRAEVERLQALLDRKKEGDERQRQELEAEVGTVRHAKLKLEEEIDALKASAAAATATIKDREAAPDAAGAPKEDGLASWQGMAAGAAAGAAVTAAVLLIYLRLKR